MSKKAEIEQKDKVLFSNFQKGRNDLFDYFFDKYYQGLCVYAYKIVLSQNASEDIVQDFFIRLWETRKNITIETSVKSYFLRSVHNRCLDFLAHQNIKEAHRAYKLSHFSQEDIQEYPLLDFELEQRLQKAVETLPDGIRETFIMNRFDGLNYKEIADKENVSVKTIEYRISKALSLLRNDLREYLPLAFLLSFFR